MSEHGGHGGHGGHGTMGVHGMLLLGEDTLYLSHLPMFGPPHNFQVLLEIGLDRAASEALSADRDAGGSLHTFAPEEFHITELDPRDGGPARTSVDGTLYSGHFERGGRPIARGVAAEVRDVVHFSELDLDASHDRDAELTYLCFGRAGELYLAHEITASPDFDQLIRVRLVPGTVTDPAGRPVEADVTRDFPHAVPVRVRDRRDVPQDRLQPGAEADAFFFATSGPTGSHGFGVRMAVDSELYVELRELGSV